MKKKWLSYPYAAWMLIFTVFPLLLFFYYGFTVKAPDGSVSFSFANFTRFFSSSVYVHVFIRSVWLAFISTVICLILGYPVAMILSSERYRHNNFLLMLIVIPMWMNLLLRTYSWLTILENTGLLNTLLGYFGIPPVTWLYSEGAIVLGMVYNFLPFMILPIYSVMIKIDRSLIEAAQDLGANAFTVFRRVKFPMSLSGVLSGVTMVFMPAVTTFAISSILSGRKIDLIGNLIETQFITAYDWNFGSAISIILLVIILGSIGILSRYENENEGSVLF